MSIEELKKINCKSKTYLLPLISGEYKFLDFNSIKKFPQRNFVNAFRYCERFPEYKTHVFVFYEKSDKAPFNSLVIKLKNNVNYHSTIDINNTLLCIIYTIPYTSFDTLQCFDEGRYSEFREEEKQKIMKFYSVDSDTKFGPSGVLYKKAWKREELEKAFDVKIDIDAELSETPKIEKETFYNKWRFCNY